MAVPDQISKGDTFNDGEVVNASRLNALVDQARVLPGMISEQVTGAPSLANDWVIFNDTSDAVVPLKKCHPSALVPGVTTFSAGDLPNVFTTSVATPSSTPALSFAMVATGGNKFLASPADGTVGQLALRVLSPSDLPVATITLAAFTLDWSLGVVFTKTLTVNGTFTFTNITDGQMIKVRIVNGPSGGFVVHWPASVVWRGGGEPVNTPGNNGRDIFTFISISGMVHGHVDQNYRL